MDDGVRTIRDWLARNPSQDHPVRQEAFFMSYSAIIHRCMTFGLEPAMDEYTAHELLEMVRLMERQSAEKIARSAFGRALAEEDGAVIDVITRSRLAEDFVGWTADVMSWPEPECAARLAAIADREERETARVLTARRHPALAEAAWLDRDGHPPLQAALVRTLVARRPDLHEAVLRFLLDAPAVLFHQDPDLVLAPVIAASSKPPQAVLAAFDGAYGEGSVIAAAEWHLEHHEREAAKALASRIRQLSVHRDRALTVLAFVDLEKDPDAELAGWTDQFVDPGRVDEVRLRRMELRPERIDGDLLVALLERCGAAHPERFYRGLTLLLKRRELAAARRVCLAKGPLFAGHPVLAKIIGTVLGGAAAG